MRTIPVGKDAQNLIELSQSRTPLVRKI